MRRSLRRAVAKREGYKVGIEKMEESGGRKSVEKGSGHGKYAV